MRERTPLDDLKVGDEVVRMIAGGPFMRIKVTRVDPDTVRCGEWEFDKHTGAEIDEVLGWGPGGTGSHIVPLVHLNK